MEFNSVFKGLNKRYGSVATLTWEVCVLCYIYSLSNLCGTLLLSIAGIWKFMCRSSHFYFLQETLKSDVAIFYTTEHEIVIKVLLCIKRASCYRLRVASI